MSDRSWDHYKDMVAHLKTVRTNMNLHKDGNMMRRWKEKGDYRNWGTGDIIGATMSELKELQEALKYLGPTEIKHESEDVAICLDFLWDLLELKKY